MRSPDKDRATTNEAAGPAGGTAPVVEPSDHTSNGAGQQSEAAVCCGVLQRIATSLDVLVMQVQRLADHFDPPPPDVVDTVYVASKLDLTTTRIAELVREREIPPPCVVPGTGHGKPWKFYRSRIDQWIASR